MIRKTPRITQHEKKTNITRVRISVIKNKSSNENNNDTTNNNNNNSKAVLIIRRLRIKKTDSDKHSEENSDHSYDGYSHSQ